MQFELCPKCGTMMNEIKRQLIIPERLNDQTRVPASMQILMECPNCRYKQELPLAGYWSPDEADRTKE
jgi:predicted nucleic-acid-binding Zn-ribbon protein